MDKILICGPRGVGKSTLIRRLTALYPGPVSGFVTKRETVADGEGLFPIYIHPAACPEARRQYGPENLIGRCDSRRSVRCTPAFDDWGPRLLEGPGLLLMDELGFLERDAHRFQEAVLAALKGDQPVLAAVKNRNDLFLQAVRGVPGVRVLYITRENREGDEREKLSRQRQRNALETQLRHAVETENFEEAAKLRDQLRSLPQA